METTQTTHTAHLDLAFDDADCTLEQAIADTVAFYRDAAPSLTVTLVTADGPSGWPLVAFTCDTAAELDAVLAAYDDGLL